jgi:predicted transcriptional regulator
MKFKRRDSRLEAYYDILKITSGVPRTAYYIGKTGSFNYSTVDVWVNELVRSKLLVSTVETNSKGQRVVCHETTEKGLHYIDVFRELKEIIKGARELPEVCF